MPTLLAAKNADITGRFEVVCRNFKCQRWTNRTLAYGVARNHTEKCTKCGHTMTTRKDQMPPGF